MKLAVLNPGGNDPDQTFPDGAGAPDEAVHPPVNYHAFAACTGGSFHRAIRSIPESTDAVLLLLRNDLKANRSALSELRGFGKRVAISIKEAGAFQVAALLSKPSSFDLFREICEQADAIATTPDLVPFFLAAGAARAEFIPTPYPVEDPRWDFSEPEASRRGIFVGTREFGTPSRHHLAALLTARRLAETIQEHVTVINVDGWRGRRMLASLRYPDGALRVVEGRMPYARYLRAVAKHKIVWQLDASAVPGQVAGDALLCRVPCVGGNGATERLAFPEACGHGRTHEELFKLAMRLLESEGDRNALVRQALAHATERLSFAHAAQKLASFFHRAAR